MYISLHICIRGVVFVDKSHFIIHGCKEDVTEAGPHSTDALVSLRCLCRCLTSALGIPKMEVWLCLSAACTPLLHDSLLEPASPCRRPLFVCCALFSKDWKADSICRQPADTCIPGLPQAPTEWRPGNCVAHLCPRDLAISIILITRARAPEPCENTKKFLQRTTWLSIVN